MVSYCLGGEKSGRIGRDDACCELLVKRKRGERGERRVACPNENVKTGGFQTDGDADSEKKARGVQYKLEIFWAEPVSRVRRRRAVAVVFFATLSSIRRTGQRETAQRGERRGRGVVKILYCHVGCVFYTWCVFLFFVFSLLRLLVYIPRLFFCWKKKNIGEENASRGSVLASEDCVGCVLGWIASLVGCVEGIPFFARTE